MRTRRSFDAPAGGPEELGHNLAMHPSDSEANGTDRDVLTSLPRTRPARRSAKRDRPGRAGGGASTASRSSRASASPGASAASGKAASEYAAAPKRATTGEPKPTAARAKPEAASPRAKPEGASSRARTATPSRSRAATAAEPRAAARPAAAAQEAASVPAASAVPPAGYATEARAHGHGVPDPFAVATTAVQAAGEIAQIGATLWGQAVRSAISRLPRP